MKRDKTFHELLWGVLVLVAGILPRAIFAHYFPAQPVSDFRGITDFAILFSKNIFSDFYGWRSFSPGLPLMFSLLIRLFPEATPETIGLWSTVVFTGLIPLIPFLVWRGVFSLRVRTIAGLLLALLPAQILFSTVVAQDNWVIIPTVALCSLALRILKGGEGGMPIWGAIIYFLAVSIRQEMLVALLPVAIAVMMGSRQDSRKRNLIFGILAVTVLLLLMVLHKGQSTGKYTLSSTHIGTSMLGSYAPGAGLGWVDPSAFLAAHHPELIYQMSKDFSSTQDRMVDLAIGEFLDRPRFHTARIAAALIYDLFDGIGDIVYWSLTAPNVLPPENKQNPKTITSNLNYFSKVYSIIIHSAFMVCMVFYFRKKEIFFLTLPVMMAIVLKIAVHAIIVITPRYFLVVIAMELLVIGVMADEFLNPVNRKSAAFSALAGFLFVAYLYIQPYQQLKEFVFSNDETEIQHTYRFPMRPSGTGNRVFIDCIVDRGWLGLGGSFEATLQFINFHPDKQEKASANCTIHASQPTTLTLSVFDPFERGGRSDSIFQVVYVNEIEVMRHDVSDAAWSGWTDVALQVDSAIDVTIELFAKNPRSPWNWDRDMIPTKFRFQTNPW